MRWRIGVAAGLIVCACALLVGAASAGQGSASPLPRPTANTGVMPARAGNRPAAAIRGAAPIASDTPTEPGQLINHGGTVMPTNNVHVMYWIPPGYSIPVQ